MTVANFQTFCACLCELMGVEPPPLEPDETGTVAFTVTYRDADVGFIEGEANGVPGFLMTVAYGTPPAEEESLVMRELMEANYLMAAVGSPAFARNPESGEISLQRSYSFSDVNVQDVYQGISNAADAVAHWREA